MGSLVVLLASALLVACNRKSEGHAAPRQVTLPARPAGAEAPSATAAAEALAAAAEAPAAGEPPLAPGAPSAARAPSEPAPVPASGRVEDEPAEAPPPPEAALRKQRSALARCRNEACVLERIPIDAPPPFHEKACSVFDARKPSPSDGLDGLGLVCRMRIARARATFRKQSPCATGNPGNPDFDSSLHEDARLQVYDDLLAAKHLKARGLSQPLTGAGGSFTLHGTHIYRVDLSTSDERIEAQAFFCISGEPKHYVPYLFSLKQEPRHGRTPAKRPEVVTEYVANLPVRSPHVLFQLSATSTCSRPRATSWSTSTLTDSMTWSFWTIAGATPSTHCGFAFSLRVRNSAACSRSTLGSSPPSQRWLRSSFRSSRAASSRVCRGRMAATRWQGPNIG